MKKILVLAFTCLVIFAYYVPTPKDQYQKEFGMPREKVVDILVEQIMKYGRVDDDRIGAGAMPSIQYERFKILKETAKIGELLQLTKHFSPVVACYASWGLIDNGYPRMDTIFTHFLDNKLIVDSQSGCIRMPDHIYQKLYFRYFYAKALIKNKEYVINYNDQPLWRMDSTILYRNDVNWLLTYRVLKDRKFTKAHLPRIQQLAFQNLNFDAIQYLHRHHFTENEDAIKKAAVGYLQKGKIYNHEKIFDFLLPFRENYINQALLKKYEELKEDTWQGESLAEKLKKYKLL